MAKILNIVRMNLWTPEEHAISQELHNTQEITKAEEQLKQLDSSNLYIVDYDENKDLYYLTIYRTN